MKARSGPVPSKVRILGGRWKGRVLEVPAGARPTSGRAREALFSILQGVLPRARVLDLYAGSGAVGLEALSRGAALACLVEEDASALSRNLSRLAPDAGSVEVLAISAGEALRHLSARGARFDVVFADPPYASGAASALQAAPLVAPGGFLVVQRDAAPASPLRAPPGLVEIETRAYGRNVFVLFARAGPRAEESRGSGASVL